MIKTIALLALLASVSMAATHKRATIMDTKTVLAEMDQDLFGSTILSAVAMNIAVSSPVEEITLFIDEIVSGINEDQSVAD
jgi:hypothetical protein